MRSTPRTALLSAGELFGGIERHLLGMCVWLLRNGHSPLLILFHDSELARQSRQLGIEPVILSATAGIDLAGPRRLASLLVAHDIQVLHAHGYRAVVNGALAGRWHKFRMVRTVHGLPEPRRRWSPTAVKTHLYVGLERFLGKRVQAVNTYVTEELRRSHQRFDTGLTTRTIYNGIDSLDPAEYVRPPELEPGCRHIGAIGRVSEVKGLTYALAAMEGLDPDLHAVLHIIGNGPLTESLQEQIRVRGLQGCVRVLGFRDNIYDYLSHLDVLIMPSLHEGLPYTILEAMSLGVPIVASRVGGIPEVLIDDESGVLIPVADPDALRDALARVLTDRDYANSLTRSARLRQSRDFDLDRMGAEFMSLYRDITAKTDQEK